MAIDEFGGVLTETQTDEFGGVLAPAPEFNFKNPDEEYEKAGRRWDIAEKNNIPIQQVNENAILFDGQEKDELTDTDISEIRHFPQLNSEQVKVGKWGRLLKGYYNKAIANTIKNATILFFM